MRGKTEENSPLEGSARFMKKTFVFLAALFLCLLPMMVLAAEDMDMVNAVFPLRNRPATDADQHTQGERNARPSMLDLANPN